MSRTTFIAALLILVPLSLNAAQVEREIAVSSGEKADIRLNAGGSITVTGWDRQAVHVVARGSGRNPNLANLLIERIPGGVVIDSGKTGSSRSVNGDVHLTIQVPRTFDISLKTMGGAVRINGVSGRISGSTMGGEINLTGIGGNVKMTTMGGGIVLRDSDVDGNLTTMGGNVLFENVVGDIKGSSMGGNVVQRNVRSRSGSGTGSAVKISTMGGNVNVDDAPAGAEVSTMGGNIVITAAREFARASTMGGDITIRSVDGWVDATTKGGNVSVNVVGNSRRGKRDVNISSEGGDIVVTLPADMQMQIEVEIAYTIDSKRDFAIRSAFPVNVSESGTWDTSRGTARRFIRGSGRIGDGAHKVRIRTVNGNVTIRRG
jgi:DUF4097 and DUF4098 domain-containing protein YvlB